MWDVLLGLMPSDYFELFGLPPKLAIDVFDLEQRYYELSRKLHPDRFVRASPAERERSQEAAAQLNDAYRTLRNPITRAEYVLRLHGLRAAEAQQPPAELLEEVFALNEALDEVRRGHDAARPQLERDWRHFLELLTASDANLDELAARHDAGDPAALEEIRTVLMRRRYLANLLAQVDRVLVP